MSRLEDGFTLIELMTVVSLIGIVSAMFAGTFSTTIRRSSEVQSQNILQTEVRAALNQLVTDLRDASYGSDSVTPIIEYGSSSITFYAPDRQTPWSHMRKIRYWLDGTKLRKQVITSSNTNCPKAACSTSTPGPPWDKNGVDMTTINLPSASDTVSTLVASVRAPLRGDPSNGGWAANQIFKYCIQSPPDMFIDPSNSTTPELITWQCTTPTSASQVKTVIIRTVVSATSTSGQFNYGAVATVRCNSSS